MIIQNAGTDGRLTLAEAEERLAGVYAAKFRHELDEFTTDLPTPQPPRTPSRMPRPLAVHAAVVAVLAALLIARFLIVGGPFFWPVFPIFWLTFSLVAHARFRGWRPTR